ncbi:hypothetical protein BS78_09G046800 [Paspalum vaginatum]|nr:hypothetical protein BS78_09G046800 [Paspalum vaginatum]
MRPWLIQAKRGEALTLVDPFADNQSSGGGSFQEVNITIPEIQGKTCLGCVHDGGWLVMLDESTGECFLLSVAGAGALGCRDRAVVVPLPPLREPLEFLATCVVLGESPPDCTVVVSSSAAATAEGEHKKPFLLHCRPGEQGWTKLVSPFRGIEFGSLIEETRGGGGHHYYLVESCGDLFLVWINEIGCFGYDGVPTRIGVYRLDGYSDDSDSDPRNKKLSSSSMAWRRVESIGDHRAFLISGGFGFSCRATTTTQGNCVYLVWSCCDCERLYKFCLDDMTVTFYRLLPQPTHPQCRAFCILPQDPDLNNNIIIETTAQEQIGTTSTLAPPWDDLPRELLDLVASNLPLVDRLRFPAVCKAWSKVSSPVEHAKVCPWLMYCSKQDWACKMLDPLRPGEEYTLRVETFDTDEERHVFRSSKDGWAIVSGGEEDGDIFAINPFTGELVEDTPFINIGRYNYASGSFSSSTPASPDYVFFGVNSSDSGEFVGVYTWRRRQHGDGNDGDGDSWSELEFEYPDMPFPVARNNPVLWRGKFYCLGWKGNLGVFDLRTSEAAAAAGDDPRKAWTILDKPEPIHDDMDVFEDDHEGREFCYLVELQGELVCVFMRNSVEPPRVFRLGERKEAPVWVEVDDIGGAALFLDTRASYAVASPEGGRGNKIFFPRYYESEDGKKEVAFYDMETKTYCPSFYGLKQPLNCLWIVPNLRVDKTLAC